MLKYIHIQNRRKPSLTEISKISLQKNILLKRYIKIQMKKNNIKNKVCGKLLQKNKRQMAIIQNL